MKNKIFKFFIVFFIISSVALFFYQDESYQESFQAKYYYMMGQYKKSYEMAKLAYEKNSFNKMAFSIMTQSEIAMKYNNYILRSNEYLEKISSISNQKIINLSDKIKIKIMCEIMIAEYLDLNPTKLTEDELINKAKDLNLKFKHIYEELF